MNFRELFSKLDSIETVSERITFDADGKPTPSLAQQIQQRQSTQPSTGITARPTGLQPIQNLDGSPRPDAADQNKAASEIPGQQPNLGPKPSMTPQELQAAQFPNQKPAPAPATVTDPKSDVNAMAQALKAVAASQQPAKPQPQLQPTSSASIQQQQQSANEPKQITTPKPGEPMEEDQLDEATREEKIAKWQAWYAKNKDKADQIPSSIRDTVVSSSNSSAANNVDVQSSKTQSLGIQFAQEKDPVKKEQLRKEYEAEASKLKQMQGDRKDPSAEKPKSASNYKGSTGSQEIKKLNPNIKNVNKIYVGQEITLPDGSKYTVKKGDTLDAIARRAKPAAAPEVKPEDKPEGKPEGNQDQGFNQGKGEVSSPNVALPGDEPSGTRWVAPDARSNAPDTAIDKLPAGQRDALDTTYSTNADNTGVVPTVDKSTFSKNAWIEKHDKRNWWERNMPNFIGGKDANIPDQPNYKTTPGEQPYRNPVPQAKQAEADKFANMSADELRQFRAAQQASGKDIPAAAINPKAPTAPVEKSKEFTMEMKVIDLQGVVEELNEWSFSDKIHPDVDYSWGDAATDVALTGAGVLATGLTGGAAAPVAAAATGARAARLANLAVKAGKNIVQGTKAAATSPSVAKDLAIKTAKSSAGAVPASAAVSTGINKALSVDEQALSELQRITSLIKKV